MHRLAASAIADLALHFVDNSITHSFKRLARHTHFGL
jgi:hypothetical protein